MNSVNIYIEANPNPNSLKFVTDRMLLQNNEIKDYPDPKSAIESPIALALFEFKYIERVFIMSNFITITKNDLVDWEEVKLELRNFIKKFIEEDGKIINPQSSNKKEEKSLKDIDKKIIQILEEYIKPAVEQDGGAIQFESFEKGTVKVSLQGACSGCPSSMVTLKSGIEKLLKRFIPEVEEVVAEGVKFLSLI